MKIRLKLTEDSSVTSYRRLKTNFTKLLMNNEYCSLCFTFGATFNLLDDEISLDHSGGQQVTSLRIVLQNLFGEQFHQLVSSHLICFTCREHAVHAYNFICNTKSNSRIYEDFVLCTENRLAEIESQLCQEDNNDFSNTFILLDNPKEHIFIDSDREINIENKQIKIEIDQESLYTCSDCDSNFNDKKSLSKHLRFCPTKYVVKEEIPEKTGLHCPDCKAAECKHIKYLQSFKKQKLQGNQTIKCPDCDYECRDSKPIFMKHVNKVHLNIITDICEICARSFHSKGEYKDHIRVQHSETYTCQYCEASLTNNKNLQEHYANCVKTERQHKCEKCPASFDSDLKFLKHLKKHSPQACETCGKVFHNASSLRTHQDTHAGQASYRKYRYTCTVCNKTYPSQSVRAKHMKESHSAEDKPQCLSCQIQFASIESYRKHVVSKQHLMKNNPGETKKHKCTQCEYSTSLGPALEAHVNRYHLKVAPYCCQVCQKKFAGKLKLDEHMKTHFKEKKIQCETCGMNLGSRSALKKHLRAHTGEKPYPCDVCSERFTSSSMRNIHKIKKHSKKSIKCPLCDLMFHLLPNMRAHFKVKHWKRKGETFDVTKVEELKEEHYELFRDRRMLVIEAAENAGSVE